MDKQAGWQAEEEGGEGQAKRKRAKQIGIGWEVLGFREKKRKEKSRWGTSLGLFYVSIT